MDSSRCERFEHSLTFLFSRLIDNFMKCLKTSEYGLITTSQRPKWRLQTACFDLPTVKNWNIYKDKQPIITYEKLEHSCDRLIDAVLVSESLSEDNFIKLLEQDNQNLHKPQNIVWRVKNTVQIVKYVDKCGNYGCTRSRKVQICAGIKFTACLWC